MRLHREGSRTILIILTLTFAVWVAAWLWLPAMVAIPLILIASTVLAIVVWFFRVPVRSWIPNEAVILSPCDGKVVVVEEVFEPEYFKDRRIQVSIFMSPLNVHINYQPISGITTYRQYHPGKYLVAWHPKSSTDNERCTLVVKHPKHGEILVRQVAGALARRICTYPQRGNTVVQGSELGFIKFGSRVDLYLPLGIRIDVHLGDIVQGAATVISRFT